MNSTLLFVLGLAALLLTSLSLRAEDWTTTDGKAYKEVTVIKIELDAVTITHHDGGARVSLVNLPADLQKRFNYDPVKAKAAADARAQADAKNAVTLQNEIEQAKVRRRLALIDSDPRIRRGSNQPTGPISDSPTFPPTLVMDTETVTETTPAGTTEYNITDLSHDPLTPTRGSNQHSTDELVDINSRLKDDHPSPNRHTASSLLLAASHLMPDPLDPTHHSTDELVKSASVMTPPSTDTGNRHSTDSLFGSEPLKRP